MKIALGSDHRGFDLKEAIKISLQRRGIETEDLGTHDHKPVDYPDFARPAALLVSQGIVKQAILICGSGLGMTMAAGKVQRVRAALCLTPQMARMARMHNNANILVMGADFISPEQAEAILDEWLKNEFEGAVRHKRRIKKVHALEAYSVEPLAIYEEDQETYSALQAEIGREAGYIELVASESLVSRAVREALGSVLTNKYADGYPGNRLYYGCENMDAVERLASERAKSLFGAEHANVQPYSGTSANIAVFLAALEPGNTILSMNVAHGGHFSHGHTTSFAGRFFNIVPYGLNRETELIDYDKLAAIARETGPKLIIAGSSTYSRTIDFKRFRQIADSVGAYLMADMAHIAGLVAADCHSNPVPFCEFVTATTHKTLCGPRGGLILCQSRFAEEIDRQVFPGLQGGPLMHVVAAKAVCFHEALRPSFRKRQQQVICNARALAEALMQKGLRIVSGGTDNHMLTADLTPTGVSGKQAAAALEKAGIIVNKISVPFEAKSHGSTSGIRVGTSVVTLRRMKEPEMAAIAEMIVDVVKNPDNDTTLTAVKERCVKLAARFPLPAV